MDEHVRIRLHAYLDEVWNTLKKAEDL
jgi:hypothetical protein